MQQRWLQLGPRASCSRTSSHRRLPATTPEPGAIQPPWRRDKPKLERPQKTPTHTPPRLEWTTRGAGITGRLRAIGYIPSSPARCRKGRVMLRPDPGKAARNASFRSVSRKQQAAAECAAASPFLAWPAAARLDALARPRCGSSAPGCSPASIGVNGPQDQNDQGEKADKYPENVKHWYLQQLGASADCPGSRTACSPTFRRS